MATWQRVGLLFSPLCRVCGGPPTRHITTNQVSTALRPFYFAVHPDLFSQYPTERIVNENSLKQLSEHLHHIKQGMIPQRSLQFFIKDPSNIHKQGALKSVRINLTSSSVYDTLYTVLRSCQLPLEYIKSLNPSPKTTASPVEITWNATMSHHGARMNQEKPPEEYLISWLHKNVDSARERQRALEPIRADVERLRQKIYQYTGLQEVIWDNYWGLSQFRACLRRLLMICKEHRHSINLKGHSVVFGNDTGFSCNGNIILRVNDVAERWLQLLQTLKKQDVFFNKLPTTEIYLSSLINDIRIVQRHNGPTILASEYLTQLRKLISSVKEYRSTNPQSDWIRDSMKDVHMVVECATGPLTISEEGYILVPSSCPVFLLVDYLNTKSKESKYRHIEYLRKKMWQCDAESDCRDMLHLASFTKDQAVSAEEMEVCCQRLLAHRTALDGVDLRDCHVRVSKFYSVMSDGLLYIPWNWKCAPDA